MAPGRAAAWAIMSAELRRESCTGGLSINWPSLMAVEAAAARRGAATTRTAATHALRMRTEKSSGRSLVGGA